MSSTVVICDRDTVPSSTMKLCDESSMPSSTMTLCEDQGQDNQNQPAGCEDPLPLSVSGPSEPSNGDFYTVSGGVSPYSWSVSGGASISGSGQISGVTGLCGSGSVTVTDACGQSASKGIQYPEGQWVFIGWSPTGPVFYTRTCGSGAGSMSDCPAQGICQQPESADVSVPSQYVRNGQYCFYYTGCNACQFEISPGVYVTDHGISRAYCVPVYEWQCP